MRGFLYVKGKQCAVLDGTTHQVWNDKKNPGSMLMCLKGMHGTYQQIATEEFHQHESPKYLLY